MSGWLVIPSERNLKPKSFTSEEEAEMAAAEVREMYGCSVVVAMPKDLKQPYTEYVPPDMVICESTNISDILKACEENAKRQASTPPHIKSTLALSAVCLLSIEHQYMKKHSNG